MNAIAAAIVIGAVFLVAVIVGLRSRGKGRPVPDGECGAVSGNKVCVRPKGHTGDHYDAGYQPSWPNTAERVTMAYTLWD